MLCLSYIKLALNSENENVKASCSEKIIKFIDGEFVQKVEASVDNKNPLTSIDISKLTTEDKMKLEELLVKMDKSE